MITPSDLKKTGYRIYQPGLNKDWAKFLFQKKVFIQDRCAYFINIYESKNPISNSPEYSIEVQFFRGIDTIDLSIHPNKEHTIEYVENLVHAFWETNTMDFDHINN